MSFANERFPRTGVFSELVSLCKDAMNRELLPRSRIRGRGLAVPFCRPENLVRLPEPRAQLD